MDKSLQCLVSSLRADYKKQKIIISMEAWLLQENLDLLDPVLRAARSDKTVYVTFEVPQLQMKFEDDAEPPAETPEAETEEALAEMPVEEAEVEGDA